MKWIDSLLKKSPVDRVNVLADQMSKNSEEMRMWKNIPLAGECLTLLQGMSDEDAKPLGRAFACDAIIRQLPEYDVPRLVLRILRYQLEQLRLSDEQDPDGYVTEDDVQASIGRLEDYIDTEHISAEAFNEKHRRYMKLDPIQRTAAWEENYYEVEKECDRRLGNTPRGMGFCHAYWHELSEVLAERGIEWRSPAQMNPRARFD